MRVKDMIPYITNRVIKINVNGAEVCRIFHIDGKYIDFPEKSYHEICDCTVIEIGAEITGICLEVE